MRTFQVNETSVDRVVQRRPRRAARVQTNLTLTLIVETEGEERAQSAMAADISDHGLRIRTEPGLAVGQRVYAFSRDIGTQFGTCRIVWTQMVEQGRSVEAGLEVLK